MKSNKFLTVFMDYILMTVGSLIFCMAWTSFLIPNGLASGGLTGLCTIVQYGTGIPVGWTYPVLNVLLLIMGFLSLGKGFGRTKKAAEQQAAYQALLRLREKGYVFKKY